MANFELKAPVDGVTMPLEQVPDPVFSQRLVGDGIAIDPVSQCLRAPCAGTVTQLFATGHALTLTAPEGVEIMLHVGLDTVNLKGAGFTPRIRTGDPVALGDPLIDFDADYLATHAKSLLTLMIVTNGARVATGAAAGARVRAGMDPVLTLALEAPRETGDAAGQPRRVVSAAILIPNPTGLHARPAAVLASLARPFQSRILLQRGADEANAKSVTSIMGIEILQGDKVTIRAEGPDAEAAVAALAPELAAGLGDTGCRPAPAPATIEPDPAAAPPPRPRSDDPRLLLGVAAAPGLAVGKVYQFRRGESLVPETTDADPRVERRRLEAALERAKNELEALQTELRARADPQQAAIFAAHQGLIEDPGLLDIAESALAKGRSADYAWQRAYLTQAERLAGLRNALLAERAADLRDVGRRVLGILTGQPVAAPRIPPGSILIAEELTPSETARLDPAAVRGLATVGGGATSHVAILAQALDLPAVAGIEPRALELPDGADVILDGGRGQLRIDPDPDALARIAAVQSRQAERQAAARAAALEPAITPDGHRIEVVANLGGLDEVAPALRLGAEGVGLLRSEFLYLDRAAAPGEDEQTGIYAGIAAALGDRPLIVRTLDVGGDKPLPYLPLPREDNPFLGIRGVRIGLERPEILRTQVRAILRAAVQAGGMIRMMVPMVATLEEIQSVRGLVDEERARLGGIAPVELGIMVEVPSAALLAGVLAREVDFFSIGTNDLTQYTLAMDRGHPKLGARADAMHPAVLRLIALTVAGAAAAGKWVGVCGGLASDPQGVPILIGLGVRELSCSAPAIPAVKAQVRARTLTDCQALARQALDAGTAAAVRALVPIDD